MSTSEFNPLDNKSKVAPEDMPSLDSTAEVPVTHSDKVHSDRNWQGLQATYHGEAVVPHPEQTDDVLTGRMTPDEVRGEIAKKRKLGSLPKIVGVTAAALIIGVGAKVGLSGDSDETAPKKENSPELVVGPDGEPVRYVEYGPGHEDRNNDGNDDVAMDINNNGIQDGLELWDQKNQEFVDPQADDDEAALENASSEDLQNIEELSSIMDGVGEPHWRAEFIALEPAVKRYMMITFNDRAAFDSDLAWKSAMIDALTFTTEDLEGLSEAN